MQYQSTCCHSDNCCKTMSVVLGIKGFKMRTSLRKTGNLCHMFSAKARESEFQTHGCRERKTLHRERFAKEMAKGKIE